MHKDMLKMKNGLLEKVGNGYKLNDDFFKQCVEEISNGEDLLLIPKRLLHALTDERNKFTIEQAAVIMVVFNEQLKGDASRLMMEMQLKNGFSL